MPWSTREPESPWDHFVFDVDADGAKFGRDSRYMGGSAMVLILTGTKTYDEPITTPEGPITVQEGETVFVSLGKEWETDDGLTAYNTAGKNEFIRQSKAGRMVDLVVESGRAREMSGEPEEAKTWGGTRWRFGNWLGKIGGEKQLMKGAVEFLGFVGDGATPAKAVKTVEVETTESDPLETRAAVVELASSMKKDGKDHATFVAAATEIDGVTSDDTLLGEIIDEAGAIWSEA